MKKTLKDRVIRTHQDPAKTFGWVGKPKPYVWMSHGQEKQAVLPAKPFTLKDARTAATKAKSGNPARRAELMLHRLLREGRIKPAPATA